MSIYHNSQDNIWDISQFDYQLPPHLIAQYPLPERSDSRLMVVHCGEKKYVHGHFNDLFSIMKRGDVLVLNDTKVFPARLCGNKTTGGKVEVLIEHKTSVCDSDYEEWFCLTKGRVKKGDVVCFLNGKYKACVLDVDGEWKLLRFYNFSRLIAEAGKVPLPPYIRRESIPLDSDRYQTVYAHKRGAIAAPTAGLHFTHALLDDLRQGGIEIVCITLHVGAGTFLPIRAFDVRQHKMRPEYYEISDDAVGAINSVKSSGGRIFAVGTTVVRTLEHMTTPEGRVKSGQGWTDLFITPGYSFKIVNALITNFHLPKSTLFVLVCAFGGINLMKDAYDTAIKDGYRFYSYGDAMLVVRN